ncbi:aspartate aminotransferase family protein [Natronospirillum operosum]|uniref:Aspartate aminotransferase family protein n=1 Tax=Natronospirillum operosum TaxID=2759953 RepID=A0A4Z0WGV2_9GAMM|nr:aspartate aminotransferase family protein [Natronospirillum operosum]TGG93988.1 aspartate aminotransferase family protein [Natronospirillum operosum]
MNVNIFEQWESDIRGYCRVYPTVFTKASNARQWDENGKSYIDFFAGAGVLNFGHNNPLMKKALVEYIESDGVTHSLDTYTVAKREFMEKFVNTILKPRKMNHKLQFMGPTGTNSVELALKMARRATGRRTVVAFSHAFHGMTLGALACTTNNHFRNAAGVPLEHVVHQPFDAEAGDPLGGGLEALDRLRAMYEDSSSGLEAPAAFIVEPIQAEGGVNVASKEWLLAVQKLAHDLGALFILDDIQAGCGRTGSYFSFDGMGLDPDVITLAKGLGGFGTPIAMNLVKPEYDKLWKPGEHTGTFRGQNLSFVAGRIGLGYFDDDEFNQQTKRKGKIMQDALEKIAAGYSQKQFQVRGKGMMQALDVGDGEVAKKIVSGSFEGGMLCGAVGTGGRAIKLIPPLTIPDEDLKEGLDIFARAVEAAAGGAG